MADSSKDSPITEDKKVIKYNNVPKMQTENMPKLDDENNIPKQSERDIIKVEKKDQLKEKNPSIVGAIFTMTSLTIGTGCLTFAKKVIDFGFLWFGVALIIGGLSAYWTLVLLIRVAIKEKGTEYPSTVRKVLGKGAAILVDVLMALYSWGIIIAYEIILNSLLGRIVYTFFEKNKYENFNTYEKEKWGKIKIKVIVTVAINAILFPLCLVKDIGKMKFFSYFCIVALAYTIIVLVIECPFFWKHYLKHVYVKNDKSTHANWYDISKSFNSDLVFFTGLATIIFCFANHQGALPVYRTLNTNDEKVMNKVFSRSIIFTLLIYFILYISSFLTTPLESEDLIIFRESIFKNDIFMDIAKIALFLELIFLTPANYNSMRCSIFHIIFGSEDVRTIPNIIISAATLVVSALIGTAYKEILNYFSLIGGFCCTTMCFLIPGWMTIKVEWKNMTITSKILTLTGIIVLCILGFIGGIQSVILFFK